MILGALALVLAVSPAPTTLQVSTAQGVTRIALRQWPGEGPMVPIAPLARALRGTVQAEGEWIALETTGTEFRFLPGAPLVHDGKTLLALPAASRRRGDSLFVPLAFVAQVLADPARHAWSWTPSTAILAERGSPAPIVTPNSRTTAGAEGRTRLPNGLRPGHRVTIDPGHGGTDPGNPGLYFPRGMHEKDVTLAVGLKVRDQLKKRGVAVTMTRTTDTLINLAQRAPRYCRNDCDLFVSIHVNSLEKRPGYTDVRGFETYFLGDAKSSDAARVAKMENDAIRYNLPEDDSTVDNLDFILRDMQSNEYLRESARAAELVQSLLAEVESGPNQGIKTANFAVLTTARRPSILVEMGYSTNRADARLMSTPDGQDRLAEAIANAIVRYLQEYDRKTADSVSAGNE